MSEADFRFTSANGRVYAFGHKLPPTGQAVLKTFASGSGLKVERVTLLGAGQLAFTQTPEGMKVTLPSSSPTAPYTLRLEGSGPLGSV